MEPEECVVTIQGRGYRWSREDGLDPEAVLALLPWIARCAEPFRRRAADLHVEFADLLQAGCLGALVAARRFDPGRKRTFITWATYKIREEMHRLCGGAFTVPLPDGEGQQEAAAGEEGDAASAMDAARILRRLPREDARLLRRHFGHGAAAGAPIARIAKERRASATSVAQKVNRALRRARRVANGGETWKKN